MIREFVQTVDDREWQQSLFSLLQSQTYNQCEVDLFELMCKVLDQNLFTQVDWARNTIFFKDLKVSCFLCILICRVVLRDEIESEIISHFVIRILRPIPNEKKESKKKCII